LVEALPGYEVSEDTVHILKMGTYLWVTPSEMPHVSLDLETTRSITRLRNISPDSSRERVILEESNCLGS
jgi:hypothetical protein